MTDATQLEKVTESASAASGKVVSRYSLKNAEPVKDNIVLKVTNFDQPNTRYYYTPYPVDTNVLIYGEVVSIAEDNEYRLKSGDHVLYNGPIAYQSIEDDAKYVVVPTNGIMLIWRSES